VHDLILWCGFVGAWLLVLGPVYQAAVELREEELERDRLEDAAQLVEEPQGSGWWWLLPPVGYVVAVRRQRRFRHAVFHQLGPDAQRDLVRYVDKATGWYLVAIGAVLIAAKETWELHEHYEWPAWAFWALMVAASAVVVAYVTRCASRWHRLNE